MTKTQEILKEGKLNEVLFVTSKRKNKTTRIQQDFDLCPTMAEQHTHHLTDLNYLINKYRPDELAAYIAAKNAHRQEIIGHDFSIEPNLQEAKNITLQFKKFFESLPNEISQNFKNHVEFLKFIDNDNNADKLIKLGLMKPKEIAQAKAIVAGTTQEAPTQKQNADNLPPEPKAP